MARFRRWCRGVMTVLLRTLRITRGTSGDEVRGNKDSRIKLHWDHHAIEVEVERILVGGADGALSKCRALGLALPARLAVDIDDGEQLARVLRATLQHTLQDRSDEYMRVAQEHIGWTTKPYSVIHALAKDQKQKQNPEFKGSVPKLDENTSEERQKTDKATLLKSVVIRRLLAGSEFDKPVTSAASVKSKLQPITEKLAAAIKAVLEDDRQVRAIVSELSRSNRHQTKKVSRRSRLPRLRSWQVRLGVGGVVVASLAALYISLFRHETRLTKDEFVAQGNSVCNLYTLLVADAINGVDQNDKAAYLGMRRELLRLQQEQVSQLRDLSDPPDQSSEWRQTLVRMDEAIHLREEAIKTAEAGDWKRADTFEDESARVLARNYPWYSSYGLTDCTIIQETPPTRS